MDKEDISFSRRSLIFAGAQLGLFGLLAGRLQYLQVQQSDIYSTMAEANRVNVNPIAPPRGRIVDRNGVLLAENDRNLKVEIISEQVADFEETLAALASLLKLSPGDVADIRKRVRRTPSFKPVTIVDNIVWENFARLNLQLPFMPGVSPRVGDQRYYQFGEATAHLVGYVGNKTRRDLNRWGNTVADTVGRSGVERQFELRLRGKAGVRQVEVSAYGRTVRQLASEPGEPGEVINLTIDAGLQSRAYQLLRGHSGSIVVMGVDSGEILAMVSTPSFEPNEMSRGVERDRWDAMLAHERKPLLNKALRGLYAPGSTFKMLVALAGLEAGVIDPEETINCSGVYAFANEEFHCWKEEGHGDMTMVEAIERSCDTYFYDLALRIGIDNIEAMARRFGLGTRTGLNLAGEKAGTVPGRDWKRANYDASWRSGETVITGIGQGFLLTTPLQLARMTAALVNGGRLLSPIVTDNPNRPEAIDTRINPRHLQIMRRAMYRVVNRPDGTAYASSVFINGQLMAGKTGTVQVRRISKAERETGVIPNEELDWHLRDHSLFVGYAPHDRPRYALSVVVEHGGGGAQVAAPIAGEIAAYLLRRDAASAPEQAGIDNKGEARRVAGQGDENGGDV